MYNFNNDEIQRQVLELMQRLELEPRDNSILQLDGQIHRYPIRGDKNGQTTGAYCIFTDNWPAGWLHNWRTGEHVTWSFNRDRLDDNGRVYFSDEKKYQEMLEKSRQHQRELQENLKQEQAEASERTRILFESLPAAQDDFPYFGKKNVRNFGLHYHKQNNSIAVPLHDINGRFVSLQWIYENGDKKFISGCSIRGAFFDVALDTLEINPDYPILICEGYATLASIYEAVHLPVVAAMTCHNILPVAEALKKKYSKRKIIIMADNDLHNEVNSGLNCANEACKKFNLAGVIKPKFKRREIGTDWNDYCAIHGEEETADILKREIYLCCLPEYKQRILRGVDEINAQDLRNKTFSPLKWAVEGFLASGLSILGGGPKVGKSILALHLSLGVAIGGCVLGKINVQQGDVLYLALEDTKRRLKERINASNLPDDCNLSRLKLVTKAPRQNEGGLDYIRWWLDEHPDARLVIIDTLQKFRKLLSSRGNMYAEDYDVIAELKEIADEYDVAFLIIHHLKKAKENEDWLNEFSGSQGLAGAADTLFSLKRARVDKGGILHRTGRDVEEMDFAMQLDGFGWTLVGEAENFTMPEWKRQIVNYLKEHNSVTPMQLSEAVDISIEAAQQNLYRLAKEGIIKKIGHGKYSLSE